MGGERVGGRSGGSRALPGLLALCCAVSGACGAGASGSGRAQAVAPKAAEPKAAEAKAAEGSLPARAARLEQFAPKGWSLERTLTGDFNRDSRNDAVLLLRRAVTGGVPERIVAVALRNANEEYELSESNRRLIPSSADGAQDDPMEEGELAASSDGFDLVLRLLAGTGSYEATIISYSFRYDQGCARLVAYGWLDVSRATLDTDELNVDFIAGTVTRSKGNAESEESEEREESEEPTEASEERAELQPNPVRCLKDLGDINAFRKAMPLSEY